MAYTLSYSENIMWKYNGSKYFRNSHKWLKNFHISMGVPLSKNQNWREIHWRWFQHCIYRDGEQVETFKSWYRIESPLEKWTPLFFKPPVFKDTVIYKILNGHTPTRIMKILSGKSGLKEWGIKKGKKE